MFNQSKTNQGNPVAACFQGVSIPESTLSQEGSGCPERGSACPGMRGQHVPEYTLHRAEHRLKPGMFALVSIVLDRADEAVLVPESALTKRAEETGVFVIAAGDTVVWRPVEVGIRHQGMVQISGEGLTGSVVTLGQQFLDDGSAVILGGKVSAQDDAS